MELICARGDGFRVDKDYFLRKLRFSPGICPRCSGPIHVVADGTDTRVKNARVLLRAEGSQPAGLVVAGTAELEGEKS